MAVKEADGSISDVGEMANVYAELGQCNTAVGMLDEALKMESRAEKAFDVMKEKWGSPPAEKEGDEQEGEEDVSGGDDEQNVSRKAWEEKNDDTDADAADAKVHEETKGE